MRVAVVGSRNIYGGEIIIHKVLFPVLEKITEIVSGGAVGIDSAAEFFAIKNKIPMKVFLPDWKVHGKSAGFIRNKDIVDRADIVLAVWDGKSKGTKHSIDYAKKTQKPVIIVNKYMEDHLLCEAVKLSVDISKF